MKLVGMLGGMSWESTLEYYRIMNRYARERLGGQHSARLLMHSVDFQPVESSMAAGDWPAVVRMLSRAVTGFKEGGADFFIICTNTMHKVAAELERAAGLPLLHIGDAVGMEAARLGFTTLGLLGTRFTMEDGFLRDRLATDHGLEVVIPGAGDRAEVHRMIFDELCLGKIVDNSRQTLARVAQDLAGKGAPAVVLGCTELPLLLKQGDSPIPLLDTTRLHAEAAMARALAS